MRTLLLLLIAGLGLQSALAADCERTYRAVFNPAFHPNGTIALRDQYLWDNWTFYDGKTHRYLRYSLSAPKNAKGGANARHQIARLRVFSSQDGKAWKNEGLIWPHDLVWSGSIWHGKDGKFWLLHTRPDFSSKDIPQKLAVSSSRDGIHFSKPEILMDPSDPAFVARATAKGYDLGSQDGLIMALRDPYRIDDDIFFAAKAKEKSSGKIVPVVGHARITGENFGHVELLDPIRLPIGSEIRQVELPNVVKIAPRRYLLSVNLTDRRENDTPLEKVRSWVRLYESNSPTGPWVAAKGPGLDAQGNLYGPEDSVYGFNLLNGTKRLAGTGFFQGTASHPFTLTGIVPIRIGPR